MEITKLLVANRGEIAVRVFRTCKRLGIATAAVCSPSDRGGLHARCADEVVEVASYLDADGLVRAALAVGADALHPGYGFLAESAGFAQAVERAGVLWIGPPATAIAAAGDKLQAKRTAAAAGVPVLPTGSADELGFPLLVKAAAGGGGRGMRLVRAPGELEEALASARREADAAFGDGRVFVERYVERPRHVEVQLLGDARGRMVALGERDCSIQRRHQKVLEECPAPGLGDELRSKLAQAAIALGEAVGYQSLGTAEFLVDGHDFFFLELNARIQVEHPVTEEVGGVDLVEQQLRVAGGEPIALDWRPQGCAIEARLYAEHPRRFSPEPGRIEVLELPDGVRVDAGIEACDEVSLEYDPLLAKLVASGPTREDALAALAEALSQTRVTGVVQNLPFLRWLVAHPVVRAGAATTAFLVEHPPLSRHTPPTRPWHGYWRLNRGREAMPPVHVAPPEVEEPAGARLATDSSEAVVKAPIPGTVVQLLVREGDRVGARQTLLVLEAMKMEMPLLAPYDAMVQRIRVREGELVAGDDVLVELIASSPSV